MDVATMCRLTCLSLLISSCLLFSIVYCQSNCRESLAVSKLNYYTICILCSFITSDYRTNKHHHYTYALIIIVACNSYYSVYDDIMIDGDNLTNGVQAELITANDGVSLLGIKVLWTIKSEYLNCQFSNLRVELNYNSNQHSRDITVIDSSADFYNLVCNEQYTPRVTAVVSAIEIQDIGDSLFYRGMTFNRVVIFIIISYLKN